MRKLMQAQAILEDLGLPLAQCNEISGFTLLALCGIKRRTSWSKALRSSLTISKGIMAFIEREYGKNSWGDKDEGVGNREWGMRNGWLKPFAARRPVNGPRGDTLRLV